MPAPTGLFTIGHSDHSLTTFLTYLRAYKIAVVIDVRSKPYSSYKPQYNRKAISASLAAAGVDYFWAGAELGGLSDAGSDTALFKNRLKQVLKMSHHQRVALMCSEGPPEKCHRAMKLAAWLHQHTTAEITHIKRDGSAVDSLALEDEQPDSWLWHDLGGERGKK